MRVRAIFARMFDLHPETVAVRNRLVITLDEALGGAMPAWTAKLERSALATAVGAVDVCALRAEDEQSAPVRVDVRVVGEVLGGAVNSCAPTRITLRRMLCLLDDRAKNFMVKLNHFSAPFRGRDEVKLTFDV